MQPDLDGGAAALPRRLRDLREHRWGTVVRQRVVAEALGDDKPVSVSLISSWENEVKITRPSPRRLRQYATFFATERSVVNGHGRLISEADLDNAERAERDKLYGELIGLRRGNVAPLDERAALRFDWRYPRGATIRIICGKLDLTEGKHAYTDPTNPDYTDLLTFADADALIELFGHLRKVNPDADIRSIRSDRLAVDPQSADVLSSDVILLGGVALSAWTARTLAAARLPFTQIPLDELPDEIALHMAVPDDSRKWGEAFLAEGEYYGPTFEPDDDGQPRVSRDIAGLVRMINPYNPATTMTHCGGVFASGVLAAVRTLTDDNLRQWNRRYLEQRLAGADRFAILMQVSVLLGTAQTPNLAEPDISLFEWPSARQTADKSASSESLG